MTNCSSQENQHDFNPVVEKNKKNPPIRGQRFGIQDTSSKNRSKCPPEKKRVMHKVEPRTGHRVQKTTFQELSVPQEKTREDVGLDSIVLQSRERRRSEPLVIVGSRILND